PLFSVIGKSLDDFRLTDRLDLVADMGEVGAVASFKARMLPRTVVLTAALHFPGGFGGDGLHPDLLQVPQMGGPCA
ncbi:MAG: hypothetical protein ACRD6W_08930, partial [Nitrososphaerales archaeon]